MSKKEKRRYQRSYSLGSLVVWFGVGGAIILAFFSALYFVIIRNEIESTIKHQSEKEQTVLLNSDYDELEEIREIDRIFVKARTNVNTSKVGTYTTIYSVFFGESYSKKIRVIDGEPPMIELIGERTMLIGNIENWDDPGAKAYDANDGDLSSQITREIKQVDSETYKVLYSVKDASGYSRSIERTLKKAKGIVCLTFDDGPSEGNTPQILDILQKYNVKATFFILSFDVSKIDIVARELNEGHTVGLHGISHEYSEIYSSLDGLMDNFYKLEDHITNNVDSSYQAKFIRFPGGSSNTVSMRYCQGIMTDATFRVTEEGYIYVDWNVDSQDAGGAETADEIYENVINGIKAGQTNIVLMHDENSKKATVEALERIIQYCMENGYVIEPINDVTEICHHQVKN